MTVKSIERDTDRLILNLVADFDAPIDRVWELWADPRLLERWWGPPGYPATVERHDLRAGGEVTYFMTGPDGGRSGGWWKVISVDPPRSLEFEDGFANEDGSANRGMPITRANIQLSEEGGHTRMEMHSSFASREEMDKLVEMGVEEGLRAAVGQADSVLAERFGARV